MKQTIEKIYRPKQVCEAFGISTTTLWRWVNAGLISRPIKLGGRSVGFPESEIKAFINQRKQERP